MNAAAASAFALKTPASTPAPSADFGFSTGVPSTMFFVPPCGASG
jgi:hypothetical protein